MASKALVLEAEQQLVAPSVEREAAPEQPQRQQQIEAQQQVQAQQQLNAQQLDARRQQLQQLVRRVVVRVITFLAVLVCSIVTACTTLNPTVVAGAASVLTATLLTTLNNTGLLDRLCDSIVGLMAAGQRAAQFVLTWVDNVCGNVALGLQEADLPAGISELRDSVVVGLRALQERVPGIIQLVVGPGAWEQLATGALRALDSLEQRLDPSATFTNALLGYLLEQDLQVDEQQAGGAAARESDGAAFADDIIDNAIANETQFHRLVDSVSATAEMSLTTVDGTEEAGGDGDEP